jgi:cbb3-type cytochrome oxidase subunit 1
MMSFLRELALSLLTTAVGAVLVFLYKSIKLVGTLPSAPAEYSEKQLLSVKLEFGICFTAVVVTMFVLIFRYIENQLLLAVFVVFGFFLSFFVLSAFLCLLEAIKALKNKADKQKSECSPQDRP